MYKRAQNNLFVCACVTLLCLSWASIVHAGTCTCEAITTANALPSESAGGKRCFVKETANGTTMNAGVCSESQEGQTIAAKDNNLLRDGLFGCTASKYANVGSTVAISGVYVPVNDAAVTLNTGYLVYKECVLDGAIAKISEAARTDLTSTILRDINQGRNGQPRWVRKPYEERIVVPNDKAVKIGVSEEYVASMCPALKKDIRRATLVQYLQEKNAPNSAFACSYSSSAGDQAAALRGEVREDTVLAAIHDIFTPGNNALTLALMHGEAVGALRATAEYLEDKQIINGFYGVTDNNENPFAETTLTPAYLVSQGAEQVYTSGFRCLEGADELSEVCAPLFSAMIPESFSSGLYNMTRAESGIASYVGRMVSEAAAAVRNEAVNVALNVLLTTRQFEFAFKQAKEASVIALTNAVARLRTMEKNCWELIIPQVCGTTFAASTRTCITADGVQLRVSTSTQFSQPIIDTRIAPLAQNAAGDLTKSTAALQELDGLITMVTNAASAANQRVALSRLDQLVAPNARLQECSPQKTLHSAGDVQCAIKERDDLGVALGLEIEKIATDWGDSTDPKVGWCNVSEGNPSRPAVLQRWIDEWKSK